MKNLRPRSFLNLVTGGLIIVSLPLVVGLFTTRSHLDKLVSQSVSLVEHSVATTRDAQGVSEYIRDLERNVRLYDIVGETRYLKEASVWHDRICNLLLRLQELPVDQTIHDLLIQFQAREGVILTSLQLAHRGPEDQEKNIAEILTDFSNLDDRALAINSAINTFIDTELTRLKDAKGTAQKTLVWQTLSFIIATILMILFLAFIISQPINQINRGIDRLGKGDFSTPVFITGPKDLEALGKKLNWLRERLASLDREKTKFIAHISHDLKTPLASIMEGSSLLQEELVGPLNKQQLAVTRILIKNSFKLQELIEHIISFNMAKAGGTPKGQNSIPLKPLIEQVASEQTTKMLAKNIRLDLHLGEATIRGNKKQIATLFENLLSNAIKFSSSGGIVCCNLRQTSQNVKCLISNNGPVIPPEEQDKIFTPFYQVKNNEQHSHTQGSGLGLAIVKEYVLQNNGTISLHNHMSGAHFMVIFPAIPDIARKR
ncbi:MAG: HAMP domain-containing histidine kinase [Proteobacteria bacterium]|nr:HAMP domain-containing histidine kinase [Pseudomonadota bacterium]MBU1059296.1 HAMP domain-containing histidine kinase [Pseudomonadota bacterium]